MKQEKHLVAVKVYNEKEIFEFDNEQDKDSFIKELEKRNVDFAVAKAD